jgi:DHA2 family methylenomycin A resistance protein-like MFS transporter
MPAEALRRRILAATSISYVLVLLDASIVNVGLDSIAGALGTRMAGLQWVVNAYILAFASLLLTGGTLGDRFGARRIYLAGLAVFTAASALCGLAPSLPVLAAARALQGIGAAMLVPCSLKLIHQAFPDPAGRSRAVGLWIGLGGVAMAAGPLLGGALIEWLGWRSIFAANLPVGLLGLALAWRIPAGKASAPSRRFDPAGQATAILALAALIGALIEGPALGWLSPPVLAAVALGVAAAAAFLAIEARQAQPMLPLSFFRSGVFAGSTVASMASALVFYGLLFVFSLYFQQARGATPLQAGVAFLPMTAMVAGGSLLSGRLAAALGPRRSMVLAFAGYALGALGMMAFTPASPYWRTVPPLLLIGAASGFISPAATAPALGTVVPDRAGVAAAVLNAARQAGAALGVALFGALAAAIRPFEAGLHAALWAAVAVSVAAALVWWRALAPQAQGAGANPAMIKPEA